MPIKELSTGLRFSYVLPLTFLTYSPLMKFMISFMSFSLSMVLWPARPAYAHARLSESDEHRLRKEGPAWFASVAKGRTCKDTKNLRNYLKISIFFYPPCFRALARRNPVHGSPCQ